MISEVIQTNTIWVRVRVLNRTVRLTFFREWHILADSSTKKYESKLITLLLLVQLVVVQLSHCWMPRAHSLARWSHANPICTCIGFQNEIRCTTKSGIFRSDNFCYTVIEQCWHGFDGFGRWSLFLLFVNMINRWQRNNLDNTKMTRDLDRQKKTK